MTVSHRISVLLLDIEGTTTPIDFVKRILFPYAQQRLSDFLKEHHTDEAVEIDLTRLKEEYGREDQSAPSFPQWNDDTDLDSAVNYLNWLMERDRKSTALKSLQGKIWQKGYEAGTIKGQVFADVITFLKEWHRQGGLTYIFSSGSALAQQLLFRHSDQGDLTPLLSGYFDTTTGPKREAESYRTIAETIRSAPSAILFVSDIAEELHAAQAAGMCAALALRPGNAPASAPEYPSVADFGRLATLLTNRTSGPI